MNKSVLALLIAVASGSAFAGWTPVGKTDVADLYVDFATKQKSGGNIIIWALVDAHQPSAKTEDGRSMRSMKFQYVFNCKAQKQSAISISAHEEPMGKGSLIEYVDGGSPTPLASMAPDSPEAIVAKAACARR